MHFELTMLTLFNSQFIVMDSIPSPQTILTMHDKLTMAMLPASVKNSQDCNSRDFLF